MCCAISASGNHLPPFYIFPRVFMKECFMNGCVPGAKGVAAKTGYMNSDIFSNEFLPFFIRNTRCSKEHPVLLTLDNHSSHVSLKTVDICRENGIHLLTLPPHTSHKLQPLDRCLYGPLKTYINQSVDDWMRSNPGKCVTIYEVGKLSSLAFMKSMTPENITSGFRCTGIYPLNSLIFGDHEFVPASVTDQPMLEIVDIEAEDVPAPSTSETPVNTSTTPKPSTSQSSTQLHVAQTNNLELQPQPSTSQATTPQPSTSRVTPMQILPLPKAGVRKQSNRRKLKSALLTDTPEKERIEQEHAERAAKNKGKGPAPKKPRKARKTPMPPDSSSEEDLGVASLESDSDSPDEECAETDILEQPQATAVKEGDFVLVKYVSEKKYRKLFVGQVVALLDHNFEVKFMRKVKGSAASFSFPEDDDLDVVTFDDIVLLLGDAISVAGTKRASSKVMFSIDLGDFALE